MENKINLMINDVDFDIVENNGLAECFFEGKLICKVEEVDLSPIYSDVVYNKTDEELEEIFDLSEAKVLKEIQANFNFETLSKMEYRLPKIFTEKWLVALRSGDFKQGKDTLFDSVNDTYCCLGVGCVVAGMEKSKLSLKHYVTSDFIEDYPELPKELQGTDFPLDLSMLLAEMNDNHCKTFNEIANWVAVHVELY